MPKVVLEKATGDFFSCNDNHPHEWVYLGKDKQMYRCTRCGAFAHKEDLKEVTD